MIRFGESMRSKSKSVEVKDLLTNRSVFVTVSTVQSKLQLSITDEAGHPVTKFTISTDEAGKIGKLLSDATIPGRLRRLKNAALRHRPLLISTNDSSFLILANPN